MNAKDLRGLLDDVAKTPGWSVEDTGNGYRVTGPNGALVHTPPGTVGRGLNNVRTEIVRAGWPGPPPRRTRRTSRTAEVVERAPSGEHDGVDELLLSDGEVTYGCPDPSCLQVRGDLQEILTHRAAHDAEPAPPEDPEMTAPTPAQIARLNGVAPPQPMTADDMHDLLTRAMGLVQRVDAAVVAQADMAAENATLQSELAAERARVGELTEQIDRMQSAARLLMGSPA